MATTGRRGASASLSWTGYADIVLLNQSGQKRHRDDRRKHQYQRGDATAVVPGHLTLPGHILDGPIRWVLTLTYAALRGVQGE